MPEHLALTPAWQDIKAKLRTAVGPSTYEIWLSALEIKSWDGSVLILQADAGAEAWVADRFGHLIERCAQEVIGAGVKVAFATDPAAVAHSAIASAGSITSVGATANAGASIPLLGTGAALQAERFNPRHTFDQFVIGDGNRLAHAAALAVAEAPGQAYNPLFLHAPPGLGKTHLLNAIANYITAFDPHTSVRYTTVEAFTNGFIAALHGRALDRFKALYRDVDVLLIDDVQFLASKAKTEEEFFHTFNAVYDRGRQLVLTCDRLPTQLTGIEQRLRDRFGSGLVAHLAPPDRNTRMTILRKRAALDHIEIQDDGVLEAIADRIVDDVRSLQGALIRVVAHHSLTGRTLDRQLTEAVLDAIAPRTPSTASGTRQPGTRRVTVEQIQRFTATQFGISREDLVGQSRVASVSWPRQLAIYLARQLTGEPLQAIGEAFGGRNHATVLHACKRVSDRVAVNNDAAADLRELSDSIGASRS